MMLNKKNYEKYGSFDFNGGNIPDDQSGGL